MKRSQGLFIRLVKESKGACTMGDFDSDSRSVLADLR